MTIPSDLFQLYFLLSLIPGMIIQTIVDGLVTREKIGVIERFFEVFMYSIFIYIIIYVLINIGILSSPINYIRTFDDNGDSIAITDFNANIIIYIFAITIFLGLTFSTVINKGWIYKFLHMGKLREWYNYKKHRWISWLKFLSPTTKTGAADVWNSVFEHYRPCWVTVHLKDGSTFEGWPDEYSDKGNEKELLLREVTCKIPTKGKTKRIEVELLYIPKEAEITFFEIHEVNTKQKEGEKDE